MDCKEEPSPCPDPKRQRGKTQQLTRVEGEWNRAKIRAHKLDKQQTLPSTLGLPKLGWGLSPSRTASRVGKSEKGVKGRRGCSSAPTPSPRLGVAAPSAAPGVAQRGRGHPWEGAPGLPCSKAGARGSRCPQDRRGVREHSPIWACFSFPLRWRRGSPCSACCSGPHWVPRCRLPLPTPPPRDAPSFSGPVTCAL